MNIRQNFDLKRLNTFGINVKAKNFLEIDDEEDLKDIFASRKFINQSKFILGGGSNILLTKDIEDLTIKISIPGIEVVDEDEFSVIIEVGSGVVWQNLVEYCVAKNYGGIENLSLIPGTVGAAPIQNIGAYGQEIKDVLHSLKGIFIADGEERTFTNKECEFGYRNSIFKQKLKNKFVISAVRFKLSKKPEINLSYGNLRDEIDKLNLDDVTISDVSRVVCSIRKSKLPDPQILGNAGSFFKNPEVSFNIFNEMKKEFPDIVGYEMSNGVKLAAGWLIDKCGWKGKRIGNTGIHEKQALVLINFGNATGIEILNLSKEVKKSVKEKFRVDLEYEVNIY
jgi:UDP-N-acetylmuramate dehydrogenase